MSTSELIYYLNKAAEAAESLTKALNSVGEDKFNIENITLIKDVNRIATISKLHVLGTVEKISGISVVATISKISTMEKLDVVGTINKLAELGTVSKIQNITEISTLHKIATISKLEQLGTISRVGTIESMPDFTSFLERMNLVTDMAVDPIVEDEWEIGTVADISYDGSYYYVRTYGTLHKFDTSKAEVASVGVASYSGSPFNVTLADTGTYIYTLATTGEILKFDRDLNHVATYVPLGESGTLCGTYSNDRLFVYEGKLKYYTADTKTIYDIDFTTSSYSYTPITAIDFSPITPKDIDIIDEYIIGVGYDSESPQGSHVLVYTKDGKLIKSFKIGEGTSGNWSVIAPGYCYAYYDSDDEKYHLLANEYLYGAGKYSFRKHRLTKTYHSNVINDVVTLESVKNIEGAEFSASTSGTVSIPSLGILIGGKDSDGNFRPVQVGTDGKVVCELG